MSLLDTGELFEHRYGVNLPLKVDDLTLELLCLREGRGSDLGGLGRYGHFRMVCQLLLPWIEWNPWLEWECQRILEFPGEDCGRARRKVVSLTGCGGAGKTFGVVLVAAVWWLANPAQTAVILTSTEKSVIRRRMWPVVDRVYKGMMQPGTRTWAPFGHFVDSMTKWCAVKGDDLHSITAVAVAKGDTQKAVDYLKGVHARRMMLVVDEATATPEAIMLAISNMEKGCDELIVVIIGNAVSRLDPHGRACEPMDGWDSITVESEEWETKGVPEWGLDQGVCLHFDGAKSPNVVAGSNLHPHLYRCENWEKAERNAERSGPVYWSQDRGFWPPDGSGSTVFSEHAVIKYGGLRMDVAWVGRKTRVAFLDTAFGGDACLFQWGEFGETLDGQGEILMLGKPEEVPVNAKIRHEVEYQIADWVARRCAELAIPPECFGMDSTGTGGGAASVVAREWSTLVRRIEWGGAASENPASEDDGRPAKEVYANQTTELHFRARDLLWAGRLRGLNKQAVRELCARPFEMAGAGKRYQVMPKAEFKLIAGKSPDYGDGVVGLCEVARRCGMKTGGAIVQRKARQWKRVARRSDYDDSQTDLKQEAFAEESFAGNIWQGDA